MRIDDVSATPLTTLPARGHGLAVRPTEPELVVMSRRPGVWGSVIDWRTGRLLADLEAQDGSHFYGHAAFTPTGRFLVTTENNFAEMDQDERTGRLGIWDAATGYRWVGSCPLHAIGPHDVAHDPVRGGFWVANGGILTHPDTGRIKLNIPDMAPSLAWVDDSLSRAPLTVRLPASLHKLSLRHLAVSEFGQVACAMQHEGPENEPVPLVAMLDDGDSLRPLDLPPILATRARGYCGDVAFAQPGDVLGAGFPRGGFFAFWSADTGAFIDHWDADDGCGIAASSSGVVVTSGSGNVAGFVTGEGGVHLRRQRQLDLAYDNHVT
jgi:hypothetical protein